MELIAAALGYTQIVEDFGDRQRLSDALKRSLRGGIVVQVITGDAQIETRLGKMGIGAGDLRERFGGCLVVSAAKFDLAELQQRARKARIGANGLLIMLLAIGADG